MEIRRKFIVAIIVFLSFFVFADHGQAEQDLFPWVRYSGGFQTTAGIGTGSLNLNAFITEADYENGEVWNANVPGIETIIGARVILSSATRTGDYSFNGVPGIPVTLSLTTFDGTYAYFVATLADITFDCSSALPVICWLNKELDANDPSTLNLMDIALGTNDGPAGPGSGPYPSRYINELAAYLAASNASGLKMSLLVPPVSIFDFTANSMGPITYGLIDGLQSLNNPPLADAGENVEILTQDIDGAVIEGSASDGDVDDSLQCLWMEGDTVLMDWTPVTEENKCPLYLGNSNLSAIGKHTLTLVVSDGQAEASSNMILTIANSAPNAVSGGAGTYEIYSDVTLSGQVSDYDGDLLNYQWSEGGNVLFSGTVQPPAGGDSINLPVHIISSLGLGVHTIILQVDDGTNDPVSSEIKVEIIDTSEPTLAPKANDQLLWPPNHEMVDIIIYANAYDNSGYVSLSASVMSNEPEDGLDTEDLSPDWTQVLINQDTGEIYLQVRRERSGSGDGRVYTVTITAEDITGNSSSADINIRVPHDKRKK